MAIQVRVFKNGLKRYRALVRNSQGKWFPTQYFDDKEDAEKHEASLIELNKKGEGKSLWEGKVTSLDEFWDTWSKNNRRKSGKGWRITQDQIYRDYLSPVLGKKMIAEITVPDIGKALNRCRDMGRSEQTVKHVYTLLHRIFNDAMEYYDMIPNNPVKARHHRPEVKDVISDYLEPNDSWKLLNTSRGHYLGPGIWLELLAGLRCEAMIGLRWDAVQWDQNQILIKQCWKAKTQTMEDYSKDKKWNYVPIVPPLKEYLLELWEKSKNPEDYVCKSKKNTYISMSTFSNGLKRLCKKAQVTVITPHELRHSCSELWISIGASTEDIRRLLNHSSLNSTKHYIHRTDYRLNELAKNLNDPEGNKKMLPQGNKEAENNSEVGLSTKRKG